MRPRFCRFFHSQNGVPGSTQKAHDACRLLLSNFYDEETGGFAADYDEYYATADAVFALSLYLPLAEDDPADIVNGKLVYSGIIYAEGGYVKVQQGDEIGQFESIGEGVAYARFNVSEEVLTDAKGENMKLTAKVAADKTEGVFGVNLGVEVQMELTFDADMKLTGATLNYSKDGATVNITVSYGYAAQEISIPASGSTAEA